MIKKRIDYLMIVIALVSVITVLVALYLSKVKDSSAQTEFKFVSVNTNNTETTRLPAAAVATTLARKIEVTSTKAKTPPASAQQRGSANQKESNTAKADSASNLEPPQNTAESARESENANSSISYAAIQAEPSASTPLYTYETSQEVIAIPFETEYRECELLALGEQEIYQYGIDGELQINYQSTYLDGSLVETVEVSREVIKEAQTYIILVGTYEEPAATEPPLNIYKAEDALAIAEDETAVEGQTPQSQGSSLPTSVSFMTPGTSGSTATNFSLIQSLFVYSGFSHYANFQDNGDGSITVDGSTYPVTGGASSFRTTSYDGNACYERYPDSNAVEVNGLMCNHTFSGTLALRGVVATSESGGFPFGTVLFIEDYGFAVVADHHGHGPDFLDLCFDPGDCASGRALPTANRNVYVISIP